MINSILKIIKSDGIPLDTSTEGIEQLERIGYRLKDNKKLDMKKIDGMPISGIIMDDVLLIINRHEISKSEIQVNIIAHNHGKKLSEENEKGDKQRGDRHYFLYSAKTDISSSIIDILKDFLQKSNEESKKCSLEIIDDKRSFLLFDNLYKIIDNHTPYNIDDDMSHIICRYIDKGRNPQFETSEIDSTLRFLIELDKNIGNRFKELFYILYRPKSYKTNSVGAINISIVDGHAGIEPTGEFSTFIKNYKKERSENAIKIKVDDIKNKIGLTDAHNTWREERKDLNRNVRALLANNLYPIVDNLINDIRKEIELYSDMDNNQNNRNPVVNVRIGKNRVRMGMIWFIPVAFIIGILVGMYVPSMYHFGESEKVSTDMPIPIVVPVANMTASVTVNMTNTPIPTVVPIVVANMTANATPNMTNTPIPKKNATPNMTNTPIPKKNATPNATKNVLNNT